ncbi:hypothetical protein BcDW1_4343 [Botrytis cinerea BcDW1]|uniref:Uncharacterized protein n=1 Tax=Botryotinia fuckeliana (strain BcDW1) TaxID=1290391 RepID=M7UT24_BOTF1|nr:hypothetical protein BcDW1_4343 [Botrytis cinerea BcDW1]
MIPSNSSSLDAKKYFNLRYIRFMSLAPASQPEQPLGQPSSCLFPLSDKTCIRLVCKMVVVIQRAIDIVQSRD